MDKQRCMIDKGVDGNYVCCSAGKCAVTAASDCGYHGGISNINFGVRSKYGISL